MTFVINFQTPTPSVNESDRGKPVAEVKPEMLRPVSKSRQRQDRTQPRQAPQPLVLSNVSMQNSKTDEKSEDGSIKNSEIDSNGKKKSKGADINGIKMERTKTNVTKKTKYSGGKDTQSGDKRTIDQRPVLHKDNTLLIKEHTSSIPNKNMVKLVEDSIKQDFIISSSVLDNQTASNLEVSKSHRTHNASDKERGRGHHITKAKDKLLPKPSPPSQQYLEGAYSSISVGSREPAWSHRSVGPASPLSSKDGGALSEPPDLDWLNTVKR